MSCSAAMVKYRWALGMNTVRRIGLTLTLLHSEWPKLYGVLAVLSAIGLRCMDILSEEAIL